MAAGKFSFMDIMNTQSKAEAAGTVNKYTEIYLDPYEVKPSESNFYSQGNIEELADSFLTVGQQQPTVLGRVNGEFRIISGHRRNLANILNVERGHEEYKNVKYLYRDMTEGIFELSLLVGNAYNRELTPYEKTEQAKRLKAALLRAQKEDGLEIQGKLRDMIAEIMGESSTNVARMESINNNLTEEAKEEFKKGTIGITAAYEVSKLSESEQKSIAAAAAAGEDVRAKEIALKVAEKTAAKAAETAEEKKSQAERQVEKTETAIAEAELKQQEAERAAEDADKAAKQANVMRDWVRDNADGDAVSTENTLSRVSEKDTEQKKNEIYSAYAAGKIMVLPFGRFTVLHSVTYLEEVGGKSKYSIEKCRLIGIIKRSRGMSYVLDYGTDETEFTEDELKANVFDSESAAQKRVQELIEEAVD